MILFYALGVALCSPNPKHAAATVDVEVLAGLRPGGSASVTVPLWKGLFISSRLSITRDWYGAYGVGGSFERKQNVFVELMPGVGWRLAFHPRFEGWVAWHGGPGLFAVDEEVRYEEQGITARYRRAEIMVRTGFRSGFRVRVGDRIGLVLTNWTPTHKGMLAGLSVGLGISYVLGATDR